MKGLRMTSTDNKPPVISLAAARAERLRDFSQERADITKELEEINVAADQLAAITQHVMFVEWAIYKAALMLDYHSIERDAEAVVQLAELIIGNENRHRRSP
jgi:hypothetical protein